MSNGIRGKSFNNKDEYLDHIKCHKKFPEPYIRKYNNTTLPKTQVQNEKVPVIKNTSSFVFFFKRLSITTTKKGVKPKAQQHKEQNIKNKTNLEMNNYNKTNINELEVNN
ncbi:hypothetical protein ACTFIT_007511 [Dictyostelium discoideum]